MRYETGYKRIVLIVADDIFGSTQPPFVTRAAAARVAESLMAMLYGWWQTQQQLRTVAIEEALDFADSAVNLVIDGQSAWIDLPQLEDATVRAAVSITSTVSSQQ